MSSSANALKKADDELRAARAQAEELKTELKKARDSKTEIKAQRDVSLRQVGLIKDQHKKELKNSFDDGYNNAIMAVVKETKNMKHQIYQAGYAQGFGSCLDPHWS